MKPLLLYILLSLACFTNAQKPFVIGETRELPSKVLNEKRILNIYLPEGYDKDTGHYSVIYLLDGSADEDFIHIAGLTQFATMPWINYLPKTIVVGISNVDRKRDFSFPSSVKEEVKKYPTTGGSEKFIAFIETELMPFINTNYKVNSNSILIGQSLGGLLATEILFKKPSLFNQYIIVSPSMWWNNGSLQNCNSDVLKSYPDQLKVYISVGKEGKVPGTLNQTMEEEAKLLADKIESLKNKNIKTHFEFLPEENHGTILHLAALNAFKWLYRN